MTRKSLWNRLGRLTSALVVIASFVGLSAPYLADLWIVFDVFSNLRLHFIGLFAAGCIGVLAGRYGFAVLAAGAVLTPLVIGLLPLFENRPAVMIEPGEGEQQFKVVSFNTHFSNSDIEAVEAYLQAEEPDIVILVEVGREKDNLLQRLAEDYPYREDCIRVAYCHIVMLSRRAFAEGGKRTNWDGPPMTWIRFGDDLGNLTVVGTHLSRIPRIERQFQQIRHLAEETLRLGDPVLVAGDFNATEWSLMLNAFQEFSGLWRMTDLPTWPTWLFGLPQIGIDHIFISNGIRPLGFPQSGADAGSDHLPVSAVFSIPAG